MSSGKKLAGKREGGRKGGDRTFEVLVNGGEKQMGLWRFKVVGK